MKFSKLNNAKTLSLANLLSVQNPDLASALKQNEYLYISCFEDEILGSQNLIRCEIGSVSFVLALICKYCLDFTQFSDDVKEYFDELDDGFLSGECNVGEEEFLGEISIFMKECENIIIDSSFFRHKDSKMIFKFLDLLGKNVILADSDLTEISVSENLDELKELDNFDGSVVFVCDVTGDELLGSNAFCLVAKIKDGDTVQIISDGLKTEKKFRLIPSLKGTVAICNADFSGYDFKLSKITKIG